MMFPAFLPPLGSRDRDLARLLLSLGVVLPAQPPCRDDSLLASLRSRSMPSVPCCPNFLLQECSSSSTSAAAAASAPTRRETASCTPRPRRTSSSSCPHCLA